MKQKKILFLLLLSSLAYSEEKSKISGEVTFGVDATFGVDGLENVSKLIPQVVDLFRAKKYKDYEKENNNGGNTQPSPNPKPNQDLDLYIPKYNPTARDIELAGKYLSRNVELRKKLSVKLKENYIGLGIKADIFGKKITHTKFLGDNEIDKIKLTLTSDNKYVNGEINYYVKGESKEKVDIDKIDDEKPLKNKVVDYNFRVNPTPDRNLSLSLYFAGQDKSINIGPTVVYKNGGSYVSASVLFNNYKRSYDLTDELDKIKYTAPGYDKVEYFKKWTLKDKYKELKPEISKDEYENEHADLEKAEVSGFKGTSRILGHYSGSLYGDSPIRYVTKTLFDEIHSNKNFRNLSDLTKILEKEEKPTATSFIAPGIGLSKEVKNAKGLNDMANRIAQKLYKRLGLGLDRKYSTIGAWTQIPSDFQHLLPGYYKDFDYSKIKGEELDPNYLYDGLKTPVLPSSLSMNRVLAQSRSSSQNKYKFEERWHDFDSDAKKYLIDEITREYELDKIKAIAGSSILGILGDFFLGDKISKIIDKLPKIQELIKNPYEMKGLDILRGLYLHQSEKERNILKYEDILRANFADVNLKENKAEYSTKLKLNAGHIGRNYKLGVELLLNDNVNVNAEKYGYVKKSNNLGVTGTYKEGIIEFNTKLLLNVSKNYLYRKDNQEKHVYDTTSLNTDTYLGLNIPTNDKLNVLLGLRHIGIYGWIDLRKSLDKNGKEVEFDIAKRDKDNNPIGKDNKSIITSQTTEKELVDKEALMTGNEKKLKRDIHQSDYIQTEKGKAVKSSYEMYNILSPRLTLLYRPYDNILFSSHLELPISIRNSSPAGIRGIYTGEIKYLIDDSFKDVIFTKLNPIKFKSMGDIEAGGVLGNDPGYYLSYRAMADLTFLRGDVRGNDKNIDFSLSLNPLIVNFQVKPRLIIAKDKEEISTKVGLEYTKGTEFSTILGFRKVLKSSKDIVEQELKPNILSILKDRNNKEYNKVKEKLPNLLFKGELDYTLTPFIDIKKEEGNFRIRAKADSVKRTGYTEKKNVEEGNFVDLPLSYFAWNYHINGWFGNKSYNYFFDKKSQKITKETKNSIFLDNQIYNFEIDTEYRQDKGINFDLNLGIVYNETRLRGLKEITTTTETKSKVVSHTSKAKDPLKILEHVEQNHEVVDIDEKNILESLKKYVKNKKSYDDTIYEKDSTLGIYPKINEEKLKEILDYPNRIKKENKSEETHFLRTKKIDANLDTYLGYNFRYNEKMTVSLGMKYNLNAEYISSNKIILEDIKLFGSRKMIFKNTLSPEIKMKYNLISNLNARLSAEMPFGFENKDFKGTKFNVKTGLEYRW
ncbi:hypothetical protein [Streptobacillus ratti]|uniref:hypothetical protein n=1 Tax=Streptobacillus ratti TaxID=1720557 RepID=UPI0009327E22|nr:hypothetical protein [Streptobacillus ratti]